MSSDSSFSDSFDSNNIEEEKTNAKDENMTEEIKDLIEYLKKSEINKQQMEQLLQKDKSDIYHNFNVDLIDLFDECPQFSTIFFNEPKMLILNLQEAILYAQYQLKEELEQKFLKQKSLNDNHNNEEINILQQELIQNEIQKSCGTIKEGIQIKFFHVPFTNNIYKHNLSDLDTFDLDKIVLLSGTVIRISQMKTLEKQKTYRCTSCAYEYILTAEHENFNQFQLPLKCKNSVQKAKKDNPWTMAFKSRFNNNKDNNNKNRFNQNNKQPQQKFVDQMCGNKKFEVVENTQVYVDYQEIKIQEPFKTIKSGNVPKTIQVILEGTLVNEIKPGDDVVITGILIKRNKKLQKDARPDLSMAIIANNIEVKHQEQQINDQDSDINDWKKNEFFDKINQFWLKNRDIYREIESRNQLIRSICPHIYQKFDLKLSIILCIIGGVSGTQNNTRIRGQCHLLIVGEPGTGKSQLLKYAGKLSQRSVFTNGIGSTSAGLTVSHTKDGGEWILEAGALVLADKGVCCIDEFNLIKKQDFPSVLEAMEQQTISGFKAGTMSKLNTRTTVIATSNPVTAGQKYNPQYDLCQNTGLSSPLVSRFDLIFVVIDECNYEADSENCDFILGRFMKKEDKLNRTLNQSIESSTLDAKKDSLWSLEQLRDYIQHVRIKFSPIVDEEAEAILVKYYQHLREVEEMHSKTTIRALESLVRLSQAHARLLYRDTVTEFDAVSVVIIMESAFNTNLIPNIPLWDYIILDYYKYMEIEELVKIRLGVKGQNQI
ncbi:P-loop containing nucleoside triphosphate hydrolase [Pseudocohnilembus persalinus]|uniref:DNA helicase n=1 Tax=Pseudocohnilembus persalinus TaxID=266149 RepID=A0A0V0QFC5_PSEPJ|nr:P-loop containing nucleoside triphosphate hydrolase [Pseudocohnilembus persalinus]|eukprot:KRX00910.1 P-loop containing nucleoside triphosphate hydrolase [Pseudocohnilembus persalinus]